MHERLGKVKTVLATAAALAITGCGPSVSSVEATGTQNEGTRELLAQIEANSIACGTKRRIVAQFQRNNGEVPARIEYWMSDPFVFEIDNLSFAVGDNEATPADIRNGKTFEGEVTFGENSIVRATYPRPGEWSKWAGPKDLEMGVRALTYTLTEVNGTWDLTVSGGSDIADWGASFAVAAQLLVADGSVAEQKRGEHTTVAYPSGFDCTCPGPPSECPNGISPAEKVSPAAEPAPAAIALPQQAGQGFVVEPWSPFGGASVMAREDGSRYRAAPNANSQTEIVGATKKGETLTITGIVKEYPGEYDGVWYQVSLADGKSAYIRSDLTTLNLPGRYPLSGTVTQGFGVPWSEKKWKTHTGVDIAAAKGTSVPSMSDGTVADIVDLGGEWGKAVIIVAETGMAFAYLHVQPLVEKGDVTFQNATVGTVWTDHLHYNVCKVVTFCHRGALPTTQRDPEYPDDPLFADGPFLKP